MPQLSANSRYTLALAATLVGGVAFAAPEREESDDATARARARDQWYNESGSTTRAPHGGPWSRGFRRFMLDAAARERAKWGRPGTARDGSKVIVMAGEAGAVGTNWVNLGPTRADYLKNGSITLNQTDAGRVRSIVPHPTNTSLLYVAFSNGGVWRTSDGGATWVSITESLGSLSSGSLAMDPANANVLYLGLGDPFDGTGIGLVQSTDGGNTWGAPVYLGASTVTTQVMVSPTSSSVVLATTDKGLFRSTDAGSTWSAVSLSTGQTAIPYGWSIAYTGASSFAVSLEANPAATSGTTDGQVWRTTDNGATWTRATGVTKSSGVGRITVASAPSNRQILTPSPRSRTPRRRPTSRTSSSRPTAARRGPRWA